MRALFPGTTVSFKTTLLVGTVLLSCALVQALLVRAALRRELAYLGAQGVEVGPRSPVAQRVRPRVFLAMTVPAVVGALVGGFVLSTVVRRRVKVLTEGIQRVAQGDHQARLPRPPDTDLEEVQHAFEEMQLALSGAHKRLAHADAQRRRLFADLAHELATPTSAILGLVDTLASPSLCPPEDRQRRMEALEQEASRLERLIADVRDLAHLDDPDVPFVRERVDLSGLLRRAAVRLEATPGERPCPTVEVLADREAPAEVDPVRMDQVLNNLLGNARRYTPSAGTIRVSLLEAEGATGFVVEDSGPGVPDEALERLGERLYRADPSRDRRTGGHGLGLSIAQAIVARHQGSLRFGRAALGGLRVEVRLPG
ncbi:MAG: HAMP domain-containing histidine kinase [Deltaproteobacteria bacterium]|nr:HAMP domain-containing histidine kinase [Deltaproteobacteria bacterium]